MQTIRFSLGLVLVSFALPAFARGPEFDELMEAIAQSRIVDVQGILAHQNDYTEFNLNERHSNGWTPLCLAVAHGNLDIVQELIDQGAQLDEGIEIQNETEILRKKVTPVLLAAQYGHTEIMTLILTSPQFTSEHWRQEIRRANAFRQPELVKWLLKFRGFLHPVESSSPDEFASDTIAQGYRSLDIPCLICLDLPGEKDKIALPNGGSRTQDLQSPDAVVNTPAGPAWSEADVTIEHVQNVENRTLSFMSFKILEKRRRQFHYFSGLDLKFQFRHTLKSSLPLAPNKHLRKRPHRLPKTLFLKCRTSNPILAE